MTLAGFLILFLLITGIVFSLPPIVKKSDSSKMKKNLTRYPVVTEELPKPRLYENDESSLPVDIYGKMYNVSSLQRKNHIQFKQRNARK